MRNKGQRKRLSSLLRRIKQIHLAQEKLAAELEIVQAAYNALYNGTAAVSSLPDEILSTIFETGHRLQASKDHFELLASHVTRHWRAVALATPEIWAKIQRANYQQELDPIAAYLRRSKTVAFDLTINIGRVCTYYADEYKEELIEEFDDMAPFCNLIAAHMGRCRRLFISPDNAWDLVRVLDFFSSSAAPILKSLHVSPSKDQSIVYDRSHQIFAAGAPRLNTVYLASATLRACHPPLETVTALHLKGCMKNEFRWLHDTFSGMPRLTHLELHCVASSSPWPPETEIHLPTLRALRIVVLDIGDQLPGILAPINAPSLEVLSLDRLVFFDPRLDQFFESLALSGPPKFPVLRQLMLSLIDPPNMRNFALAFPSVTHLTIHRFHDNSSVFWQFSRNQDSGVYWPDLHTLAIPDAYEPIVPVWEFLLERIHMGHPVQNLLLGLQWRLRDLGISAWEERLRDHTRVEVYENAWPKPFPANHC